MLIALVIPALAVAFVAGLAAGAIGAARTLRDLPRSNADFAPW